MTPEPITESPSLVRLLMAANRASARERTADREADAAWAAYEAATARRRQLAADADTAHAAYRDAARAAALVAEAEDIAFNPVHLFTDAD